MILTPGGFDWGLRWLCSSCGCESEASYRCSECGADLAARGSRERFDDRRVTLPRDTESDHSDDDSSGGSTASDVRDMNAEDHVAA